MQPNARHVVRDSAFMPGVNRSVARRKLGGRIVEAWYWRGRWSDFDGKQNAKTYFIKTHGEEGATGLAIRAREMVWPKSPRKPSEGGNWIPGPLVPQL